MILIINPSPKVPAAVIEMYNCTVSRNTSTIISLYPGISL